LEILEQKISVFKKTEHAQVHAHACHQPPALVFLSFGNLPAEPEVHRRRGKEQRCKWRIPRAVKNVTGDDQEIFSRLPAAYAPIEGDDDNKEDNERQ
jgi:hypothetical protein